MLKFLTILTLSTFLFITNQTFSQSLQKIWEKKFIIPGGTWFADGTWLDNENIVLLGSNSSRQYGDFWLLAMNSNGDTLWSNTLGGFGRDKASRISLTPDGGIIVIGSQWMGKENGGYDIWTVKANAVGDTVWTKRHGGEEWDLGEDVLVTREGDYMFLGVIDEGAEDEKTWMTKTNANGDILWSQTYNNNYVHAFGESFLEIKDGGFLIVSTIVEDTVSNDADAWLLRTDSRGDTLWTARYSGPENHAWPEDVIETSDGNFTIVGTICKDCFNEDFDVWLFKVDRLGNTIWSKNYPKPGHQVGNTVVEADDGSFIIGSGYETNEEGGKPDIGLLKVNASGVLQDEQLYPGGFRRDAAGYIFKIPEGGYYLIGPGTQYGLKEEMYGWVMRLSTWE